jgi:hypothetical protein
MYSKNTCNNIIARKARKAVDRTAFQKEMKVAVEKM